MYLGPLDTSCISYSQEHTDALGETKPLTFNFGGERRSLQEVALAAAHAQEAGEKFVKFGWVYVTPNYVWVMIAFAMTEGWFCDALNHDGQDHNFNADKPTPGARWQETCQLRASAYEEAATAKRMRESGGAADFGLAYILERKSERLRRQADSLAKSLT